MNRADAWNLVAEHTQSLSLRRHMMAVEAAMRAYARRFEQDEEFWGVVGLVHDFDYEEHPDMEAADGHPLWGVVMSETLLEKSLVAVDELTGFLTAVALVRPSQDIRDITKIKSVRNKWKDKSFAAAVNREEIAHAAESLGVDLWQEHVPLVLDAMKGIAAELGLDGADS